MIVRAHLHSPRRALPAAVHAAVERDAAGPRQCSHWATHEPRRGLAFHFSYVRGRPSPAHDIDAAVRIPKEVLDSCGTSPSPHTGSQVAHANAKADPLIPGNKTTLRGFVVGEGDESEPYVPEDGLILIREGFERFLHHGAVASTTRRGTVGLTEPELGATNK